jgi:hypothetical protein
MGGTTIGGGAGGPDTLTFAVVASVRPASSVTVSRTTTSPLNAGATNDVVGPANADNEVEPLTRVHA